MIDHEKETNFTLPQLLGYNATFHEDALFPLAVSDQIASVKTEIN